MKDLTSVSLLDFGVIPVVKKPIAVQACRIWEPFCVHTREGIMQGKSGDWLLIGVQGERYPVDNDIFEQTYELVTEAYTERIEPEDGDY